MDFTTGVTDAKSDLAAGWVPKFNLDFVVSQLRVMIGASDSYIAGYLSVLYCVK